MTGNHPASQTPCEPQPRHKGSVPATGSKSFAPMEGPAVWEPGEQGWKDRIHVSLPEEGRPPGTASVGGNVSWPRVPPSPGHCSVARPCLSRRPQAFCALHVDPPIHWPEGTGQGIDSNQNRAGKLGGPQGKAWWSVGAGPSLLEHLLLKHLLLKLPVSSVRCAPGEEAGGGEVQLTGPPRRGRRRDARALVSDSVHLSECTSGSLSSSLG